MVTTRTGTVGSGERSSRTPLRRPLSPRGVAFAAMVGNAIELYDFVIYAYIAATVFGPLFFPTEVPWIGVLLAVSAQALAFVTRPLGAVIFGSVGDRFGRRPALLASLVIMGGATVLVGLLPGYAVIGVLAPILLICLRLVQGVAIGGEYPGAVVVAVEHAPRNLRTLFGAFPQVGNMIGLLLAGATTLIVSSVVGAETWTAWAWRIPFIASAVLLVIGVVLRTRLAETPAFLEATERVAAGRRREAGIRVLLRDAWRPLVVTTLAWLGPFAFGYAFLTSLLAFVTTYRPEIAGVTVTVGLVLTSALLIVVVLVFGRFGDAIGKQRIIVWSGVLTLAWAVPSYLLVDMRSPLALWVAMAVGAIAYGAFGGVMPSMMSNAFPVTVRYLGVAVAIAAGALIGGALLPIPALALVGQSGGSSAPLMAMMAIGGAATVVGGALFRRLPSYQE
ncbi:MFS transporter [Microbacterium sp. HD4P20]|uniref:MFS transporter n=1 Tax=Microbacterium sp. HD4P20 TaxID=2864874 RepID=UPI001C6417AF|nr:MFS transporter [Microbacterium sp. HD4P20]MCP2638531.1 MFS transporter [Microbacterium sp. HD4P20]